MVRSQVLSKGRGQIAQGVSESAMTMAPWQWPLPGGERQKTAQK